MRTHTEIVAAVDPKVISEKLGLSFPTVRSWGMRNSIPAPHWRWFVENEHATYEELGAAAAQKVALPDEEPAEQSARAA